MPLSFFNHGKRVKIRRQPSISFERLVYSTLIVIFDTLDDVLRWVRPFDEKLEDKVRETNSPSSYALNSCFDVAHRV
jgi:hypothetical protein